MPDYEDPYGHPDDPDEDYGDPTPITTTVEPDVQADTPPTAPRASAAGSVARSTSTWYTATTGRHAWRRITRGELTSRSSGAQRTSIASLA